MKKEIILNPVTLSVELLDTTGAAYYGYRVIILPRGGRVVGEEVEVTKENRKAEFTVAAHSTELEVRIYGKAISDVHGDGIDVVISRFVRPLATDTLFSVVFPGAGTGETPKSQKLATITVDVIDRDGTPYTDFTVTALTPGGSTDASATVTDGETTAILSEVPCYRPEDPNKPPLEIRLIGKPRPFEQQTALPALATSHSFMLEPLTEDLELRFVIA